jgi:hypothetical protein
VALAPFFERIYGAIGRHLSVSRESLAATLSDITVGIRCGTDLSANDVWIAELSANLLARLYPKIAFSGPERLCSSLRDLVLQINPSIAFAYEAPSTTTICVGFADADGALFPTATGWVAQLHHSRQLKAGPSNPYAAAAAATLACSELFRRVFQRSGFERDTSVSLLDFSGETGANLELPARNIGEVLFVGVGGVGNAAIWALGRHIGLKGKFWFVDHEDLTILNLQRYLLGTYSDVSVSKVELARRAFQTTKLTTELYRVTLEQFAKTRGGIDIPTICISVDNKDSRRSAQALLPKLVINGWTGDSSLGASWHVFSRDAACLACLYHPHGPGLSSTEQAAIALGLPSVRAAELWVSPLGLAAEDIRSAAHALGVEEAELMPWRGRPLAEFYTQVVCGGVPLNIAGIRRVEVVPLAHQSALAGILMASELVKRTIPELAKPSQPESLVSWDNVLQPPPSLWRKPRAREARCICGDPDYQTAYRKKWDASLKRVAIVA